MLLCYYFSLSYRFIKIKNFFIDQGSFRAYINLKKIICEGKTYNQLKSKKKLQLSDYKRTMRAGIWYDKLFRVKDTMSRVTNVIYCFMVLNYTEIYKYLTDFLLIYKNLVYYFCLKLKSIHDIFFKMLKKQHRTNVFSGNNRTIGKLKVLKNIRYRATKVMINLLKSKSIYFQLNNYTSKFSRKFFCTNIINENLNFMKGSSFNLSKINTFITDKGERIQLMITPKLNKNKLIHELASLERLIFLFKQIKPKVLFDDLILKKMKMLSKKILAGKFAFSLNRKLLIAKLKNKSALQFLTIVSYKNKIILKAIAGILISIYEPLFLTHSHGYRINKNCHTAFQHIDQNFRGID